MKQSLLLDYKFFRVSKWNFLKKVHFLVLKYCLIVKNFFKTFELGNHFCWFDGKKIYYDNRFGLAGYQSLLSRHQYLLQLAGVDQAETVVDVGANVGFFSALSRDIFPSVHILAFEPIPKIFECLEKNFRGDTNIQLFNVALSDTTGQAQMSFHEQDSAISHIAQEGNVMVQTKRLDDVMQESKIDAIDILKIDTETFEAHVLRGATLSLAKTQYLFIEITMENNPHYTISSLLKLLSTEQYDFQLVGFRNYGDTSMGPMPIMDALFKNIKFHPSTSTLSQNMVK